MAIAKGSETIQDHAYVASVWFERDRANVSLSAPDGREIFSLWDDEVHEAIEDGFLRAPRLAMSSRTLNDAAQWQPLLVDYAREQGLIE